MADLNEPVEVEEVSALAADNNLGSEIYSPEQIKSRAGSTHVYSNVWFAAKQLSENPVFGKNGGISSVHLKNESNEKERSPYSVQAGNHLCFSAMRMRTYFLECLIHLIEIPFLFHLSF